MKNIVRLGFLITMFMLSGTAFASSLPFQEWYADTPSELCGPIAYDKPCYISTGTYIQCTAKGSQGQTCQTTRYSGATPVGCASVRLSANCQCSLERGTYRASGLCSYYP